VIRLVEIAKRKIMVFFAQKTELPSVRNNY
jgi:hypothetical protein